MKIFELTTAHGTTLQLDRATGLVCHGPSDDPDRLAVLVWLPPDTHRYCVLVPAGETGLAIEGDGPPQDAIGLRAERVGTNEYRLRQPFSGLYVCAEPNGEPSPLLANRTAAGPWEQFRFVPANADQPGFKERLLQLDATFRRAVSPAGALETLRTDDEAPAFGLIAALRALRIDEVFWLGREIGQDPHAARRLARYMPDDVWATDALPALATFIADQAGRRKPYPLAIGADLDHLAQAGFSGEYVSLGQTLNAAARRDVVAPRTLCVVATARNEGLYLVEWLAYHRLVGVEAFFLYTNDNDDGSDELLTALAEAGVVNWIRNTTAPGISPQYKAYGHAFQLLPDVLDYRWAAVIDLDEFIVFDTVKYASIPDFLSAREAVKTDAIALSWQIFGSSAETRWSSRPVTERFQRRSPGANPLIKAIFRPNTFLHAHCHYPVWDRYTSFAFTTATGAAHPQSRANDAAAFSSTAEVQDAWINHYSAKSAQEYLLRRASSRGDMALALRPSAAFFTAEHANFFLASHLIDGTVVDDRARTCAPALDAEIATLMALPGVASAVEKIERSFGERIRELAPILTEDPRFHVPGSPENWFMDLVA